MAGRRIVVDLSAFYLDHRRKSLLYIDRNSIKIVQHVINHISRICLLDEEFEIFISDAHVPRSECADIIQEGDVLRIEKVCNLPDVNGTSLHNKKTRKDTNDISLDDVIPASDKKKKRKAPTCEVNNDEIREFTEEKDPEALSSSISEPKKKKKKKKLVVDSQDVSCEATCSSEASKLESKKGKSTSGESQRKYLRSSLMEKDLNTENTLESTFAVEANLPIEPDKMQTSTPCRKDNHLSDTVTEKNSVGLQGYNVEKSLKYTETFDRIDGNNEAIDNFSETYNCTNGSRTMRKRRRQRKRKRITEKHESTCNFNKSKVLTLKSLRDDGSVLAQKMRKEVINSNHVRFSDDDDDDGNTVARDDGKSLLEERVKKAKDTECVSANGVISRNAAEVRDLNEESCTVENTSQENKGFPQLNDDISGDGKNDVDVSVGNFENFIEEELVNGENDNHSSKNGVKRESVVNKSKIEGTFSCEDNVACTVEESLENPLTKPEDKSKAILHHSKGNRRKNIIIAMGVGATLSLLNKESNVSSKDQGVPQERYLHKSLPTSKQLPDLEMKQMTDKKDKSYSGYPVLEKVPRKGDLLAFKIFKLNERYEPTITGFLEGKVIDCDYWSTVVTIKILGGAEELKKTRGKFDVEEEDSDNTEIPKEKNEQEILQLKWDEFIEPRLVFP